MKTRASNPFSLAGGVLLLLRDLSPRVTISVMVEPDDDLVLDGVLPAVQVEATKPVRISVTLEEKHTL